MKSSCTSEDIQGGRDGFDLHWKRFGVQKRTSVLSVGRDG